MIETKKPPMLQPKIFLIDTQPEVEQELSQQGFNCSSGSFGHPYSVETKGGSFFRMVPNDVLNGVSEMEVVVVDLASPPLSRPNGDGSVSPDELDWWKKHSRGEIDPRPRSMAKSCNLFDRIYKNGGVFVIFAENKIQDDVLFARSYGGQLSEEEELTISNWDFLSELRRVITYEDSGREIKYCSEDPELVEVMSKHFKEAQFSCNLQGLYHHQDAWRWKPLAVNKFGETISALIAPKQDSNDGIILILPRVTDQAALLKDLLKDILPSMAPNLFPLSESKKWEARPEYEFPAVRNRRLEIKRIEETAKEEVLRLERLVEKELAKNAFLFELVTGTGDALVEAVMKALQLIGFNNVVDMDEKLKAEGRSNSLREDLRIEDKDPLLIVDVKGVNGHPSDGEALQSSKHTMIYMQESDDTKARALSIINHQRSRPPLERDNHMPFRQEILDNAKQVNIGLLTGWDLFRLARGVIRHGWEPDLVTPLFYQIERIAPVPIHYKFIGEVAQVWQEAEAFSIHLENEPLKKGDFISIEFPVDFEEQKIESIRVNDEDVTEVAAGVEIGLKWNSSLPVLKKGLAVYRLSNLRD